MAYLKLRKKKVRFIAMMPETRIREIVKAHPVVALSQPVQEFYNGPCAAIDILTNKNFNEIEELIQEMVVHPGST